MKTTTSILVALALLTGVGRAAADEPAAPPPAPPPPAQAAPPPEATPPAEPVADPSATPPAEAPATPAKPPPYSLPWQLRPIVAASVIRSDTSFALYEDAGSHRGMTIASLLTAAYRIPGTGPTGAGLAPLVRLTLVTDDPAQGNAAKGGVAIVNPLVGAAYAIKLDGGFRLNAFLGLTIPVGGGGGDTPDAGAANSRAKGINARAQMDNALFAVNDFTVIPGLGAAWVGGGFTVQAEVTLLQLMRVRGDAVQKESTKTNSTAGLHVGYFVIPEMSIGAELRYQRWLNAPIAVDNDKTDATKDTVSMALGPRFHFKVGDVGWLRPGIAYQRGLDKPLAASTPNYHIVQLDLPFVF